MKYINSILILFCSVFMFGATLLTEHFDDANYAARNWYDNTSHGTNVSGGQINNCLQWAWTSSGTTPTNGGAMRHAITATDNLYISMYVKFQTGWRGSQQTYHPHMLTFPSDLDDEYCSLANNYLDTYLEFISDVGSPYTIRPAWALQDAMRVNTGYGTPPVDITATTENRSVNYCNGYLAGQSQGTVQTCYDATGNGDYYSATGWKDTSHSLSTNEWHKVEYYYKMNSISGGHAVADGVMKGWIDGTQVFNYSNIVYRTNQDATKKWAQVVLSPWIGDGSPITQTMWIDELIIGTDEPYQTSTGNIFNMIIGGGVVK